VGVESDNLEFMKDLRIILEKMSGVVSMIGEYWWPEGVRSQRVSKLEVKRVDVWRNDCFALGISGQCLGHVESWRMLNPSWGPSWRLMMWTCQTGCTSFGCR